MFFTVIMFIGCNVLNINPLKCVSVNNQVYKIRTTININRYQQQWSLVLSLLY